MGGRPFANIAMKKNFGPLCDAPSPKEYIDPCHENSDENKAAQNVFACFKLGRECLENVVCRNIGSKKPKSIVCVKPLRAKDESLLYRYVLNPTM
jgi:hypothetical protein